MFHWCIVRVCNVHGIVTVVGRVCSLDLFPVFSGVYGITSRNIKPRIQCRCATETTTVVAGNAIDAMDVFGLPVCVLLMMMMMTMTIPIPCACVCCMLYGMVK